MRSPRPAQPSTLIFSVRVDGQPHHQHHVPLLWPNPADPNTVNEVIESNIFGWGDPSCASLSGFDCLTGLAPVLTWTNNAIQNTFSTPANWAAFLSRNDSTYPGKWSGNAVSSDARASVSGSGAAVNIGDGEMAIHAGGR